MSFFVIFIVISWSFDDFWNDVCNMFIYLGDKERMVFRFFEEDGEKEDIKNVLLIKI